MYRVFSCLATEHDYWLVALAAVVCVSTTLTTFMTYSFAVDSRDFRQIGWSILTGVCAGTGIWATHFVAMLAYDGGFPTAYDPIRTLASLLIAVLLSTAGFALAARGRAVAGWPRRSRDWLRYRLHALRRHDCPDGPRDARMECIARLRVMGVWRGLGYAALHTFHRKQGQGATAIILRLRTADPGDLRPAFHVHGCGQHSARSDRGSFSLPTLDRPLLAMATAGITFIVLLSAIAAGVIHRVNIRCENALREQNSRFDAAVRYLPVGLSMFDAEHRLIMCNASYRDMYGLTEEATQPGTCIRQYHALACGKRPR